MRINLKTLSRAPLVWKKALPSPFAGVRLPGANLVSASGEFGSLCMQEFTGDHFSIRYNVFNVLQQFTLTGRSHDNGLYAQLILKGDMLQKANELNEYRFRTNQFTLINVSSSHFTSVFERGVYITFDTFFSNKMIREFLPFFPSLKKTIDKQENINAIPAWADIETIELVHDILHCRYETRIRLAFFDTRVRDLLFKYLVLLERHDPAGHEPSGKEIQAVREAERIINADITKHIIVPQLSKKVKLNEFRFKAVFKKVFGIGPYEYLVKKRMKKAKELLEEGLSVKEVAARTGYRPSDFTTVFRKQFDIAPSSLKKRHS